MINLIPNQEKKRMIHGFYYRLAVLFLATLSICFLIAICALLPSFFFSNYKNSNANQKLALEKSKPVPLFNQETSAVIKDLNSKLTLIENAQKNKFPVSERVIKAVLSKKVSSIKINQIIYENRTPSDKKISIRGTAPSREVLLLFRQALEDDPSFKSVDLPISNFIKGSDIQFYLTLIPA